VTEDTTDCCQAVTAVAPSPFDIVQLAWYDGVTKGLAMCRTCGRTYTFDVVVSSNRVRVYGFARIAEAQYRAVAAIAEGPAPSLDRLQEWREAIAVAAVRATTYQAERDLFVVASDIEEQILLATKVGFETLMAFLVQAPGGELGGAVVPSRRHLAEPIFLAPEHVALGLPSDLLGITPEMYRETAGATGLGLAGLF
jgi:hypothetical protein